jgi:2-polyprenyl-3-methyl-5-hydroxy-6-metoxy-1,4-benzoquinol methylase
MNPGTEMLFQMAQARHFNRWMAETIAPFIRGNVLEIGAGIGNLTEFLSPRAQHYLALDTEEEHLSALRERLGKQPNLETLYSDAADPAAFRRLRERFDTVIALNVLEHIPDDKTTLRNIFDSLRPGGRAIILVPQCKMAFGSLDEVLEHQRRYSRHELIGKLRAVGFRIERILNFNRATLPGWILNSRILRRRTLSNKQLLLFNSVVPFVRRVDPLLPWPATSLIAVAGKET